MKSEKRVMMDDLINKGTKGKPTMYFKGALFNGVGFDVYSNGQLKYETNFKDGERDGLAKEWYEDGQLSYETNFKDGEYDGVCKSWVEDGQLYLEENWKDGEYHGLYKEWYEDGFWKHVTNYKDGKQDGLAKEWDEDASPELQSEPDIMTLIVEEEKLELPLSNLDKADSKIEQRQKDKIDNETKYLIRINFESVPDDLGDDLVLVRGCLVMVQDPNNEWAYGFHVKYQGGGTCGEYHIVSKWVEDPKDKKNGEWHTLVGDFIDPIDSCSLLDTSNLKGFDLQSASKTFKKVYEIWRNKIKRGYQVECPSSYDSLFMCYKSELSNYEEEPMDSFWYSEDNLTDDDRVSLLNIYQTSKMVPGNMTFLR